MTLEEVVATFNQNLEDWQQEYNLVWLKDIHAMIKLGGVWAFPEKQELWRKTEEGFDKVEL